jgi:Fe-Mn family superoxide dismutase
MRRQGTIYGPETSNRKRVRRTAERLGLLIVVGVHPKRRLTAMAFQLPELPYAKEALAPHISAETLEFHWGKHHRAYVNKTNEFVSAKPDLQGASLVDVIREANSSGEKKLFNNSAQLWNHSFFWQCLSSETQQQPSGKLAQLIDDSFGGTDQLLQKLGDVAVNHFSNGWAWLVLDRDQLKITSLHDADTPLVHDGMVPLFTLDVWEHAYYIDYRNERPRFVTTVLSNIVNWDFVAQNLDGRGADRANQQAAEERTAEPIA